ncbi:MAG: proton-conducting transporter membrane subunit [Candidatus Omnitrophica bacterium]|nr:proton-conducting transporter membrane subunit [Candidatus Omnitrophota bacterium]
MDLRSFFKIDFLNSFVIFAIAVFSILIILYSTKFMKGMARLRGYYLWVIITGLAAMATASADNLIVLLVFWGFLGLSLYILIGMGGDKASPAAKKAFIIVGGSDALMILGIGLVYTLSGTFNISEIRLELNNYLGITAFICFAVAALAKAGLMPFHSWIPDCAEVAPIPVTAFLPASLDKLLGIYLLARLTLNLFVTTTAINIIIMLMGAFTIIAAVMMALVQHDMKRLLGYHAVSQVGYMVLGIGTGNPIGIAGGMFHMLNNVIYKSCLFLTSGNVEYRMKTTELDKLGGLAKLMPITYISCLIASLSISGIPPFNGFASKWMIYQGVITQFSAASLAMRVTGVVCLLIAMFGSALTLASFMKLIHATYLGQQKNNQSVREVSWTMWLPCVILAVFCVLFGVFAMQLPLRFLILPILGGVDFMGTWYSGLATGLILIALGFGWLLIRIIGSKQKVREDSMFAGGEFITTEENRVSGTEFYNTVKDYGLLPQIYKEAGAGDFDIYEQGKKLLFGASVKLRHLHNGVLPTYMVWCLLGAIILFLWCVR